MKQHGWKYLSGVMVLCGSLFVLNLAGAQNTTPSPATKPATKEAPPTKTATPAKEEAPAKKVAKKPAGRLPVYYADIVTEEQRLEIYSIQAGYAVKLSALAEQIKAIQAQQNAEIESLLTAEQKAKLQAAKDEAAAKRKARAEAAAASEAPKKVSTE